MPKYNIVRRTVAFNLNNPDHKEYLEHADKRQNFSNYIRTLIDRDKNKDLQQFEEINDSKENFLNFI